MPSDTTPGRRERMGRRLRQIATGLAALAVVLGAGWAGWTLNERLGDEPPIEVNREVRVITQSAIADGVAPSVVGLDIAAARQAFADSGAPPDLISAVERDQVGPAGLVVEQSPAPAAELADGEAVELQVSRAVTMPDLVGEARLDAREQLERLGAVVSEESEYQPGATGDAVIRTVPDAGESTLEQVAIVYAEPESSVALADLESAQNDCAIEDARSGGAERTDALVCPAGATVATAEYRVEGKVGRLTAEVGLDDDAPSAARARLRVIADGEIVEDYVLESGATQQLDAEVVGAERIVLAVRAIGDDFADLVFAEPALLGSRQDIDTLPTDP